MDGTDSQTPGPEPGVESVRRTGLIVVGAGPTGLEVVQRTHRVTAVTLIDKEFSEELRSLDQVAYVRFASVYREFRDVSQFLEELSPMISGKKPKKPKKPKGGGKGGGKWDRGYDGSSWSSDWRNSSTW